MSPYIKMNPSFMQCGIHILNIVKREHWYWISNRYPGFRYHNCIKIKSWICASLDLLIFCPSTQCTNSTVLPNVIYKSSIWFPYYGGIHISWLTLTKNHYKTLIYFPLFPLWQTGCTPPPSCMLNMNEWMDLPFNFPHSCLGLEAGPPGTQYRKHGWI